MTPPAGDEARLERLERVPLSELIRQVRSGRATGTLVAIRAETTRRLSFHEGNIVLVQSNRAGERIGEFLVSQGILAASELSEALAHLIPGEPFGTVLVRYGLISPAALAVALRDLAARLLADALAWRDGSAAFEAEVLAVPPDLHLRTPTASLLFQATRQVGDVGPLSRGVVAAGSLFDWVAGAQQAIPLPLSPQEYFVLSRFEGRSVELRTAETLVPDRSLLHRTLAGFLLAGWLAPHDPSAADDAGSFRLRDAHTAALVDRVERMEQMSYYELLEIPRGASQAEIKIRWEERKAQYDSEHGSAEFKVYRRKLLVKLDEAFSILGDPDRRRGYDAMLAGIPESGSTHDRFEQRELQKKIARANWEKAKELHEEEDYWGAIQLLEQSVAFDPEVADYHWLLGLCQMKNPKWLYEAAASFQTVVALDPSRSEAWIELGRLFSKRQMFRRAESAFAEALRYDKESEEAREGLKEARGAAAKREKERPGESGG